MFFKNARQGHNDFWIYIVGIIAVSLGYALGQLPLTLVLLKAIGDNPDLGISDVEDFQNNPDFSIFGIDSNVGFLLLLMMFIGALIALYLIVRFLHKKSFLSLFSAWNYIRWGRVLFGFILWFFLTLLLEGINYAMNPSIYQFAFDLSSFIPLFLIAVFVLPLQTSFEELLFRGYLFQGFGLWLKRKVWPLLITSLLFGLIHSMNPEIQEFGFYIMQSYYLTAGLFLGIITIMDDGLELALGVHAATNIFGALFVGYEGAAIQTQTLFKTADVNPYLMTVVFLISAAVFIVICSKRYQWASLTKIFDKITYTPNEEIA